MGMGMGPSLGKQYDRNDQVDANRDKFGADHETNEVTNKTKEEINKLKKMITEATQAEQNAKQHNTPSNIERGNSLEKNQYNPLHINQSLQRLEELGGAIPGSKRFLKRIETYQTRLDKGEKISVEEIKQAVKNEYYTLFKTNASETDLSNPERLKLQKDKIDTNIDGLFIDHEQENIKAFSHMVNLSQTDRETKNTLIREGVTTIERQYQRRNKIALTEKFEKVEVDAVEENIKNWLINQEINTSIAGNINRFDVLVIDHFLTSEEYDPQETGHSRESLIVDYLNSAKQNRDNETNIQNLSNPTNPGLIAGLEDDQEDDQENDLENNQAGYGRMEFLLLDQQPTSRGEAIGTIRRIGIIINTDGESLSVSRLESIKGYILDIQETWEIHNNEIANTIDMIVRHIDGLKDGQVLKQITAMQNETDEEIVLSFLQAQQNNLDDLGFSALYALYDLVGYDDDQPVPTDKSELIDLIKEGINERIGKSKLGFRGFIENGIARLKGNTLETGIIRGEDYKLTVGSTDFLFHQNKQGVINFYTRDISTSNMRNKTPIQPGKTYKIGRNMTALTGKLYDNSIAKHHCSLTLSKDGQLTLEDTSNRGTILKRLDYAETDRIQQYVKDDEKKKGQNK